MEMKDLSKLKYIHLIYTSVDQKVHCERFTVVYSNSEYVYYKPSRKNELGKIKTSKIEDKFESIEDLNVISSYWNKSYINQWFIEVKNFNSQELTLEVFKQEKSIKLEHIERAYKMAEGELEKKRKELEKAREIYK